MQRLKTRSQFQAVLAGQTLARTPHFALHAYVPHGDEHAALFAEAPVWMGAMVPKRWARRAVTRNLIKRQIYSISSQWATGFPAAAHLVRLRSEFDRRAFQSASSPALKTAVRAEIEQLLQKFRPAAPAPEMRT